MRTLMLICISSMIALRISAQGTTNLNLKWSSFDGGGGMVSNRFGHLYGTLGQPNAGKMNAGNFVLVGGFWALAAIQTPGAPWLNVRCSMTNTVIVTWPLPDNGWKLQATAYPAAKPVVWTEIAPPYLATATTRYYVEPTPTGARYYRLHNPCLHMQPINTGDHTMKTKHTALTIMLLTLGGALASGAPMGTAFTYQGQLFDGTNAASGLYDLSFTLYDAAGGGSVVAGPVIDVAVTVANGLFTTTLEFGASAFNGDARWVEIAARTNGAATFSTFVPRQAITPTPYALDAANATTLGGQVPSYYAPASGSSAYVAKGGDTMTGTLVLPANGLAAGSSQLVLSNGNVGVGTANPLTRLHLAAPSGATVLRLGDNVPSGSAIVELHGNSSQYNWWMAGNQHLANGLEFTPSTAPGGTTFSTPTMALLSNGNVGIGTNSPSEKLEVSGNAKAAGWWSVTPRRFPTARSSDN